MTLQQRGPAAPGSRLNPCDSVCQRYAPAMPARVAPDAPRQGATLSYLPALDGMRGIAMLDILGVHAGVYLTAGGFFLLDSFFACRASSSPRS